MQGAFEGFVLETRFHVCLFPLHGDCFRFALKRQSQGPWRQKKILALYLWHIQGRWLLSPRMSHFLMYFVF